MMKRILVVLAVAFLLGASATPAKAATVAELQAQIAQLMAQISGLSGGSTAVSTGYKFNTNLTVGSTGADVVALQDLLSAKGFLSIPAGTSKGYFGQLTKSAVSAYQASAGVSATGFVGPMTREKLNMSSAPVVTTPGSVTPSTPSALSGGEGQLTEVDNTSADVESTLDEGEEDVKVFGAEFDAEDSDVMVERVDVDFTLDDDNTTESDNLEDYITEVSLFWGDKKLATLDVDEADVNDGSSSDDLTDDDNDVYSFRFTGLNAVVKEDDTAELYVAVSGVNNLDSTDTTGDWKVIIPDNGIRAVDAAGISETYVSGELTEESFSVEGADAGNLDLTLDSGDNEDRVVQLNADTDTDGIEILKFSLESDTSDNNVDEIQIDLATTTATTTSLSTVIKRLKLYADGKEVGSESVSNGSTGGASATFENLDLDIEEDAEVEFVVKADFNDDADEREGYEFEATVDASEIDAEDAEGDTVTVSGDVTGGDVELRTTGVSVAFVSKDEDKTFAADASGEQDIGTYKVVFKVTAFEEDVYLDRTVTRDDATAGGSAGDGFMWATTSDSTVGTTSLTATVSAKDSSGSDTTTKYKISKGETREFTLSVDLDASDIDGTAAVMLTAINWTTTSGDSTPDFFYTANLDDFKTDNLSLYTF